MKSADPIFDEIGSVLNFWSRTRPSWNSLIRSHNVNLLGYISSRWTGRQRCLWNTNTSEYKPWVCSIFIIPCFKMKAIPNCVVDSSDFFRMHAGSLTSWASLSAINSLNMNLIKSIVVAAVCVAVGIFNFVSYSFTFQYIEHWWIDRRERFRWCRFCPYLCYVLDCVQIWVSDSFPGICTCAKGVKQLILKCLLVLRASLAV